MNGNCKVKQIFVGTESPPPPTSPTNPRPPSQPKLKDTITGILQEDVRSSEDRLAGIHPICYAFQKPEFIHFFFFFFEIVKVLRCSKGFNALKIRFREFSQNNFDRALLTKCEF